MQKNKQSLRFGIGVTNLLIVQFVNIVRAKDLSNSNINMKKTTLIKAFWSTNYEWNKNPALYGPINTPMPLLLFNGDCMIASQIFLSITRELHISHCYKQFMNKIKFEHEWSHALNEYHEFIIFSLEANECFSIILAYD